MAHEKLSPRQKMIGMMYLVLTAMLALNVSKEAVEAFKNVDRGLSRTLANYAAKNSQMYEAFDKAATTNPAKAGPARDKAYMVKQRSDELFDYLQDLKIEIIKTAEGEDTPAVVGRDVLIDEVKKIDENNGKPPRLGFETQEAPDRTETDQRTVLPLWRKIRLR